MRRILLTHHYSLLFLPPQRGNASSYKLKKKVGLTLAITFSFAWSKPAEAFRRGGWGENEAEGKEVVSKAPISTHGLYSYILALSIFPPL